MPYERPHPSGAAAVVKGPVDLVWKAIRRLWAAVAIACFPFLFILDGAFDFSFSPVLPGLIALVLVWALVPYAHLALLRPKNRIWLHGEPPERRHELRSRYVLGAAVVWMLVWLVFA